MSKAPPGAASGTAQRRRGAGGGSAGCPGGSFTLVVTPADREAGAVEANLGYLAHGALLALELCRKACPQPPTHLTVLVPLYCGLNESAQTEKGFFSS